MGWCAKIDVHEYMFECSTNVYLIHVNVCHLYCACDLHVHMQRHTENLSLSGPYTFAWFCMACTYLQYICCIYIIVSIYFCISWYACRYGYMRLQADMFTFLYLYKCQSVYVYTEIAILDMRQEQGHIGKERLKRRQVHIIEPSLFSDVRHHGNHVMSHSDL